ncbi:mitogen-activated protein kinase kinase kinase 18-like [Solanum pennellii]|uniref:Mitogen-activated protein kinase kinase kinase 18-like n=1 Tax=Solanum pennellii TaxID=28526 RepID=A0ABM1VG13_SOLPN|nr:mitogen-activated protein kinase kinase kinase 18-like [Solanum pennellii]
MMWKKLRVLGAGSYGTVSLATPLPQYYSGTTIYGAVKSAELSHSSSLRREGEIFKVLDGSDYVVQCMGEDVSIENDKHTYNLMLEYAAGGTLHDIIHNPFNMIMGESEAAYYTFQILSGISHIHRKGYVHCDLKPANILVFPRPQFQVPHLKLTDFGLSLTSVESLTYRGERLKNSGYYSHRGTLVYAAPECIVYGIHSAAVDIWALGCIVVEMLTGEWLWPVHRNKDELMFMIAHRKPEIPKKISDEAKDFLSKCFEKDNCLRYSADMLLHHPFIKKSCYKNLMEHRLMYPSVSLGCGDWISSEHLFSTISPRDSNFTG